jgi:hypothetical protein
MNRRGFLNSLIGGVATAAAVRTWPFRVFSFSSTTRLASLSEQYRMGVLGKTGGFEWYSDEEIPILWVPRESVIINLWNPRTGELIATRGM